MASWRIFFNKVRGHTEVNSLEFSKSAKKKGLLFSQGMARYVVISMDAKESG